jgi:hypothetical protein
VAPTLSKIEETNICKCRSNQHDFVIPRILQRDAKAWQNIEVILNEPFLNNNSCVIFPDVHLIIIVAHGYAFCLVGDAI